MGKTAMVECDNCHTTERMENVDGWLQVVTMVGDMDAYQRRLEEGPSPDFGDFCSLRCCGEWAFAQELLRDLSEEVDPQ